MASDESVSLKNDSGISHKLDISCMKNFTDVTIVCDDNKTVQAHKLILSAASKFFKNLFTEDQECDSVIFLPGVKLESLQQILKFIYSGRVDMSEKEMRPFSMLALNLKITGALSNNLELFHITGYEKVFCDHTPQCVLRQPNGPPGLNASVISKTNLELEVKFETEIELDDSNDHLHENDIAIYL